MVKYLPLLVDFSNIVDIMLLTKYNNSVNIYGGIAQLGERLNGIQEASGSIPLISTKSNKT